MIFRWFFFCAIFTAGTTHGQSYIAFIGDSITAGAAVQPEVKFDVDSLWPLFMGRTDRKGLIEIDAPDYPFAGKVLSPPVSLPMGPRDYQSAAIWFPAELLKLTSEYFINRPEYSWANFIGHSLGYDSESILIAAENGHKSEHAVAQMARILRYTKRIMPDKTFIFFTGNDICSPVLQMITSVEKFRDNIQAAVDYSLRFGQFADKEYDIYFVPFLQISQLYGESLLEAKRVRAHGKLIQCGELLKQNPQPWLLSQANPEEEASANIIFNFLPFPKNQGAYCPSLFGRAIDQPRDDPQYHRSLIANRVRAYRDSLDKIVKTMREQIKKRADIRLNLHLLTATTSYVFAPEDFAQDCFHLSATGQWRLAQLLLQEVQQ